MSTATYTRDQLDTANRRVLIGIHRVNIASTIDSLAEAAIALNELVQELKLIGIPHLLCGGNAALDVAMVASVIRPLVEALRSSGEVDESGFIASHGVDLQALSLAGYYLRQSGAAVRVGRGKSAVLKLVSQDINPGAVRSAWTSIQPSSPADIAILAELD